MTLANKNKISRYEKKLETINSKIEVLENEKITLEYSCPFADKKDYARYFKIGDLIFDLDTKYFEIQEKIEDISD